MLFLPLLGAECRAGKEGNFAPTGQRGRENCDLAEQRSARTRLSLCKIFSAEFSLHFFIEKMQRNPIQSLSHAPRAGSLCTREPWLGAYIAGRLFFRLFGDVFRNAFVPFEKAHAGVLFFCGRRRGGKGCGGRRDGRFFLLRLPGGEQGFEEIKQTETFHSEKNPSFS